MLNDTSQVEYLGSNPSPNFPILSLILLSTVLNLVVFYLLPTYMTPSIKSYILRTIHACISVLVVCLFFIYGRVNLAQVNGIIGGGIKDTNDVFITYLVCYSTGYFTADTILMLIYKSIWNLAILFHHMVHIGAMVAGVYTHIGHFSHFFLHGEELSTIPLSLRTIFSHRKKLQALFNQLFLITFILCRLIYGTIICWYAFSAVPAFFQMATNIHDTKSIILCSIQVILCILTRLLNVYWTYIIINKIRSMIRPRKKPKTINVEKELDKLS